MRSKNVDGQMNLFGDEPYQPKKAASVAEQPVELSTEAEEFLSVGRKKKKEPEAEKEPEMKTTIPAEPKEAASTGSEATASKAPERPKPAKRSVSANQSIVMQKSFRDSEGKTATAAYVDYNMVYVETTGGRAALTHYPTSSQAVSAYLQAIEKFEKTDGMRRIKEHPGLRHVSAKEWEEV